MSEPTNLYRFLPWAVAIAITFAVVILLTFLKGFQILNPWHIAEYITSDVAIKEFGTGSADAAAYWPQRLFALSAILLLFIVGPSLWIYAEMKNQMKDNRLKKGIAWYAGACIILTGILYAVPGSITKAVSSGQMWERSVQSASLDNLKIDLSKLAYEASELYYLPEQEGGLDGSFKSIALENMESYSRLNPGFFYRIAPVTSDSILTIYGVSDQPANNATFKNVDGERGKIQLAVNVDPAHEIIHFMNEN